MGAHHASVFLYKQYQDEARKLVEQVDQQNYAPLRERTRKAIQQLQRAWPLSDLGRIEYQGSIAKKTLTQEWPLLDHGESSLATENDITSKAVPAPRDLGHWFLIILAEYLQPCPSPLGNWRVLDAALDVLGWQREDLDLLFIGLPTSKLLKPDVRERSPYLLNDSVPYWFWLHPNAARSGWLPVEEIHRLHEQLRGLENEIGAFDVRQIPNIDADNPVVVRDFQSHLQLSYLDTLAMLSTATKFEQGLFMSIIVYT